MPTEKEEEDKEAGKSPITFQVTGGFNKQVP